MEAEKAKAVAPDFGNRALDGSAGDHLSADPCENRGPWWTMHCGETGAFWIPAFAGICGLRVLT